MRPGLAALTICLFPPSSPAQLPIHIPAQHRVPNTARGCCGYAALETAALTMGHRQFAGATASRDGMPYGATTFDQRCGARKHHPCHSSYQMLAEYSADKGVSSDRRPSGSFDDSLIARGMRTGAPVLVGTTGVGPCAPWHMQVALAWSPSAVTVYDPDRGVRTYRRQDFRWDGGSLLLRK